MTGSKITTAAFLAGATTIAVSLPAFGSERDFDLSGFDKIVVSSGLSAEIEIGDAYSVSAESSSNRALDRLDIRVKGNTLYIERDSRWSDWSIFAARRDATVKVSLPDLTQIAASAGSDVFVSGDYGNGLVAKSSSGSDLQLDQLEGGTFSFEASSGSTLRAEGNCGELDAASSSGASIRADELHCGAVEASASSGSDIWVHANETVNAQASSGADVRVSGSASVFEKSESSGGDVHRN